MIDSFSIRSKYSKSELSRQISAEREYVSLEIPKIGLDGLDYGYRKDHFFVKIRQTVIEDIDANIYIDKLVTDRTDERHMLGAMLRSIPFHLDVDTLLAKGKFVFEEMVDAETEAGQLLFAQIESTILHLSNTYPEGQETTIESSALFMGISPLTLKLSFDQNDTLEHFTSKGHLSSFNPSSINQFLTSNLQVRAEGEIAQLYFTVSGDHLHSNGDMKMRYEDFTVQILKDDRLNEN
jgi:hypothetical protein